MGAINVLVNNHAFQYMSSTALDIPEEQWLKTFDTNIHPFFFLAKAALPHMTKGDTIINDASVNAYVGRPDLLGLSGGKPVLLQNEGGKFAPRSAAFPELAGLHAAAVADLDGDCVPDLVTWADAGPGLGLMVSGGELSALAPAGADAVGPAVRGGLIYDVFGVEPAVEDVEAATHGEPVSFEFLLETDPAHLWVVDRDAATGEEGAQAAAQVLDNEIVRQTTAYRNDQIVYLDPVAWYIVFGGIDTTRIMIDDVLQIAE